MDSLTQIVLGAAVGEALLGPRLGNKALLLGAIGGTIPDLDVLYNFIDNDPFTQLRVHRAYSHAMFIHLLLALPFAWLSVKWTKPPAISFRRWYGFWFLCFFTHALLDCCTTYGTRLFLPFTDYQVAFNNISIVDPLYTLPFLLLLGACLFYAKESRRRRNFFYAAILVSSVYMMASFMVKYSVHRKFRKALDEKHIVCNNLDSTPTMFNIFLWAGIAENDDSLYIAEYSILQKNDRVAWVAFARHLQEIKDFACPELEVLEWFSDGHYLVQRLPGDTLGFYNAKWGRGRFDSADPEKTFFFNTYFYAQDGSIKNKMQDMSQVDMGDETARLFARIGF